VDGAAVDVPDYFISRADANPHDVEMATKVAQTLEGPEHGARVFLQQCSVIEAQDEPTLISVQCN
jgi:hypothetical protein